MTIRQRNELIAKLKQKLIGKNPQVFNFDRKIEEEPKHIHESGSLFRKIQYQEEPEPDL